MTIPMQNPATTPPKDIELVTRNRNLSDACTYSQFISKRIKREAK